MSLATAWRDLEDTALSERLQTQKGTHYGFHRQDTPRTADSRDKMCSGDSKMGMCWGQGGTGWGFLPR